MIDHETWNWIKIIAGAVAFYWAWQAGLGANLAGAVAILAGVKVLGGLLHTGGTLKHR